MLRLRNFSRSFPQGVRSGSPGPWLLGHGDCYLSARIVESVKAVFLPPPL